VAENDGFFLRFVARVVGRVASIFLRIERTGPEVPSGPVLVVANHPNSLLDPLVIFRTAGRPSRPLAKAPLFEQAFTGMFLKALGGLPVYRKQDHPELMHLNDRTFDAAIAALHNGDAVQIYPEGTTHSEPSLAPLRTGAARIAYLAESRRSWELGLRIMPVGLTYQRKHLFRGRALAVYGESFPIAEFRDAYEDDAKAAVRALTDRITAALEALTLNFAESQDLGLVETAERLYAREKGWAKAREREDLAARFPRLQEFARGLAWLRAHDADRHRDVAYRVARYRRRVRALGAEEGDVPKGYRARAVLRYLLVDGVPFALGLPLAVLGRLAWLPLYYVPGWIAKAAKPHFEALSTYKLSASFLLAPLVYAVWLLFFWRTRGVNGLILAAVILPLLGLVAVAWKDRWHRIREDLRLFRRAIRRRGRRRILAEWRASLADEFDSLWEEMKSAQSTPEGSRSSSGSEASAVTEPGGRDSTASR